MSNVINSHTMPSHSRRALEQVHMDSNTTSDSAAIASDFQSYLPVLSPSADVPNHQHADEGRSVPVLPGRTYEEDVADRNIERYSAPLPNGTHITLPDEPLSPNSVYTGRHMRNYSTSAGSVSSTISSVPTSPITRKPVGDHGSDFRRGSQNWKQQQQQLLDGVVDLTDSVHTHRESQTAPAVLHETIKPHEHEIIQHEIHREIHNYTYYHRIQPVIHTEVLPPRHWIPNPDGEGLIEISADELPERTGSNRWWEIIQKDPTPSLFWQANPYIWRTEPEVIQHEPYINEQGFERRDTTIHYPPVLKDMSEYRGLVQPVHFDHKTGERWLEPMTTMDKLHGEVFYDTHTGEDSTDSMNLQKLRDSLPVLHSNQNSATKRKPVGGAAMPPLGATA